jgi:hypothetical protein
MRQTFLEPTDYRPATVQNVLLQVKSHVPIETVLLWTPIERVVACDWALRRHAYLTDAHSRVGVRMKPSFVEVAER